jgi:hypothetical protein
MFYETTNAQESLYPKVNGTELLIAALCLFSTPTTCLCR